MVNSSQFTRSARLCLVFPRRQAPSPSRALRTRSVRRASGFVQTPIHGNSPRWLAIARRQPVRPPDRVDPLVLRDLPGFDRHGHQNALLCSLRRFERLCRSTNIQRPVAWASGLPCRPGALWARLYFREERRRGRRHGKLEAHSTHRARMLAQ